MGFRAQHPGRYAGKRFARGGRVLAERQGTRVARRAETRYFRNPCRFVGVVDSVGPTSPWWQTKQLAETGCVGGNVQTKPLLNHPAWKNSRRSEFGIVNRRSSWLGFVVRFLDGKPAGVLYRRQCRMANGGPGCLPTSQGDALPLRMTRIYTEGAARGSCALSLAVRGGAGEV